MVAPDSRFWAEVEPAPAGAPKTWWLTLDCGGIEGVLPLDDDAWRARWACIAYGFDVGWAVGYDGGAELCRKLDEPLGEEDPAGGEWWTAAQMTSGREVVPRAGWRLLLPAPGTSHKC